MAVAGIFGYQKNMTKRKMIDFIKTFELYPTMNSWNRSYGYSLNAKIHKLPLTLDEKDVMYEIVGDQELSESFYSHINDIIYEYENKINKFWDQIRYDPLGHITELKAPNILTPERVEYIQKKQFEIGFNGRSGGHLVLYKWNGYNYAGTGWHYSSDELEEMSKEEVKRIYTVLSLFSKCFDKMLDLTRDYAKLTIQPYSEERTVTVTGKRFA